MKRALDEISISFNFLTTLTIQCNFNLIERSLQSSEAHIEDGQSLGFCYFRGASKVWRTLGHSEICDKV